MLDFLKVQMKDEMNSPDGGWIRKGFFMTGKQRAYLRSLANTVPARFQIGKGGIENHNYMASISSALEANELIKIHVLETVEEKPRALCDMLCEQTGAEPVQVIGKKIVLYKRSKKHPVIELPE